MQYRVAAFKCKVNSVIDLTDDMIPVGTVYLGEDLFLVVLDPLQERKLPEEEHETTEEPTAEKADEVLPSAD